MQKGRIIDEIPQIVHAASVYCKTYTKGSDRSGHFSLQIH